MRLVRFFICLHWWSFKNVNLRINLQRHWQSQTPPQPVAQTTTRLSCEGHKSKFTMRLACTSGITGLNQSERAKGRAAGNSPNKSMHLFVNIADPSWRSFCWCATSMGLGSSATKNTGETWWRFCPGDRAKGKSYLIHLDKKGKLQSTSCWRDKDNINWWRGAKKVGGTIKNK